MVDSINTIVCFLLPFFSFCQDHAVGTSIQYTNCGPDTLKNVDMSPCTQLPCVFHKGTNVTVTIDFSTDAEVSEVNAKVYGIVAGIPVSYPLPQADGCKGCNLKCPLTSGLHKYVNVFPVLEMYPERFTSFTGCTYRLEYLAGYSHSHVQPVKEKSKTLQSAIDSFSGIPYSTN